MPPATTKRAARRSPITLPRADFPVSRLLLDNGLRVVLAPDRTAGVVGVAVHTDYTDYFEVLPASALERGLFLEADRMRAPKITAENLANQVDVVSEEIRLNVLSRPYGGFPWITLPPVMFNTFANAHDGYGAFEDLRAATVPDCADFFERYYTPANAVLTLAGDFDPEQAAELIGKHFGDVPPRPAPDRPSFAEPWPTSVREADHPDELAPVPALAVGWRLPDPVAELRQYLAHVLLGTVLSEGESSRLQSQVIAKAHLATDIWAGPGLMGGPLDARDPDVFVLGAIHPPQVPWSAVVEAADEQIAAIAADGPTEDERARAAARFVVSLYRENDGIGARTLSLGSLELLHGRAELLSEIPTLIAEIGTSEIAAAAKTLSPDRRAILRINPAGQN